MSATYYPGRGVLVSIDGTAESISVWLRETVTIAFIERHITELSLNAPRCNGWAVVFHFFSL